MDRQTHCTDCGVFIGLDAPGIFQCQDCWSETAVRAIIEATPPLTGA